MSLNRDSLLRKLRNRIPEDSYGNTHENIVYNYINKCKQEVTEDDINEVVKFLLREIEGMRREVRIFERNILKIKGNL